MTVRLKVLTMKMFSYTPIDGEYRHELFIGIGFRFARTNDSDWGFYDKNYDN